MPSSSDIAAPPAATCDVAQTRWTSDGAEPGSRCLPEEVAVAIVHDASTTAVMMATPADLEDFAVGFSLSEGVIEGIDAVRSIDIVAGDLGIEARVWLASADAERMARRRRRLAGPTGCGLCGVDSLAEAIRPARDVTSVSLRIEASDLLDAMSALTEHQPLGRQTRAMHAAGFWTAGQGIVAVREDVGRHNALDKLVGALARSSVDGGMGVVLLTSRVSVEMVQKTAVLGASILCAVSAPTALAIRTAEAAGITLVAVARSDGFEVFTRPDRIVL